MTDIHAQMVEFPSGEGQTPGYLAVPQDADKHPGVVVIQEWWGLVPHIKEVVERFAEEGFIAIAPDLYHGQAASEPDEARKLAMELEEDTAVDEIRSAIEYLKSLESVSPKMIGVVGFCMGGMLVQLTAERSPDVGAAVMFYGHIHSLEHIHQIQAPFLGLFGGQDRGIPASTVHDLEKALEAADIPHEVHTYPNAKHAFFNDTRPEAYNPDAAQDAWQKTLAWFRRYLK